MSPLRKAASFLSEIFRETRGVQPSDITSEMVMLASAIQSRQADGQTTTLRQLHKISSLGQPQALTLAKSLERDGLVVIGRNAADAFESTITLTEAALHLLETELVPRA